MSEIFWHDEFDWVESLPDAEIEETEIKVEPQIQRQLIVGNQIRFAIHTIRDLRRVRKTQREDNDLIAAS